MEPVNPARIALVVVAVVAENWLWTPHRVDHAWFAVRSKRKWPSHVGTAISNFVAEPCDYSS
jgi:hypothetical protein